jgi:hypothetical protein
MHVFCIKYIIYIMNLYENVMLFRVITSTESLALLFSDTKRSSGLRRRNNSEKRVFTLLNII